MYQDAVDRVNIQAAQLNNITSNIFSIVNAMVQTASQEPISKASLRAYVASIDVQMTTISSQTTLLQQALDDLAGELAG